MTTQRPDIWAVIPAAGIGERMLSSIPKQYLTIQGKTILQHSIERLLGCEQVCGVIVAIREDDDDWQAINITHSKPIYQTHGGDQRADSVLNALAYLKAESLINAEQDWVLVHDAVRPCVRVSDIENLIDSVLGTEHGGILAMPVRDTMKRADSEGHITATIDRNHLWHALTPQLFGWQKLYDALSSAISNHLAVTDEASAMEMAGFAPLLVAGSDDNIKITRPADLKLAESTLSEKADD